MAGIQNLKICKDFKTLDIIHLLTL